MAAEVKDFIVAIELGSSKVTGIAGQKRPDGSISVLAMVKEDSSSFIRKGVVYNIDKTAQCLTNVVKRLEAQLKTRITQVFVGVGGQSIRSVRNTISKDLPADSIITQEMVVELMDANRALDYPEQKILDGEKQIADNEKQAILSEKAGRKFIDDVIKFFDDQDKRSRKKK